MTAPDSRNIDSLTGAVYFIVGHGTEGGGASYRLSVAGVTDTRWGDVAAVAANSGYSIGTIQVDLGQRGNWALGETSGPARAGQTTYVDGLIEQSARYARANGLPFPTDHTKLRSDLLTHGNGEGRSTITFIDSETRDSVNKWASSSDGKKWIHENVDYPQVRNAAEVASSLLNRYGGNITEDHRLETAMLLAKTANQWPGQLHKFEKTLEHGGTYEDMLETARRIKAGNIVYDGLNAVAVAERYKEAFNDPEKAPKLERAQAKVVGTGFDPSTQTTDSDIQEALAAIGHGSQANTISNPHVLRSGSHGDRVVDLQSSLATLDVTDARGMPLTADGNFGPSTKAAVEKFQASHGMTVDGIAGKRTQEMLRHEVEVAKQARVMSIADPQHPGVSLYHQALDGVRSIDEQRGRTSDQASCQLAGSLAVAACTAGFNRIDHVAMSDNGARAYAIQGALNSPFKQYTDVDVARAVTIPLERSGVDLLKATHEQAQQQSAAQQQQHAQQQETPVQKPGMSR